MADDNDGWSDEESNNKGKEVKYEIGEVIRDYIPESNAHLPLLKYERVYVFKKNPNGLWEGEKDGVYGVFPGIHVKIISDSAKISQIKKVD